MPPIDVTPGTGAMPYRNTREHWGHVSIALHWLTAVLVLGLLLVGFLMESLPNTPFKREVYVWHKSFGLIVGALTLLRIGWRLAQPSPRLPAEMARWKRYAARAGHAGLYLLLLLMPVSGALYNYASNFRTPLFDLVLLERAGSIDRELRAVAGAIHEWAAWALVALLLAHAAAALSHHYRWKDRVLHRMAPWIKPPT